ncbi:MAG: AraC family transcriptional regulator [Acutalibacter sp.]
MVNRNLKEERHHGDISLPVSCYRIQPDASTPHPELECHWHDEMELFKVERGAVRVQCGSDYLEARAGEMVFFNSGELHAAQPLEGQVLDFAAVVFRPEMLCGDENDIARRKYVAPVVEGKLHPRRVTKPDGAEGTQTLEAFDRVMELLVERPPAYELRVRAQLLEIFASLTEAGEQAAPQRERIPAQGIKTAIDYIRSHYRQPITIGQLAELSHMSDGHFCRLFKKYTLKTPVQYINRVRLSAAMDLLLESDRKVLDIAFDTGFNSLSYFIGVFKQSVGCTPTEFRRRQGRPDTNWREAV